PLARDRRRDREGVRRARDAHLQPALSGHPQSSGADRLRGRDRKRRGRQGARRYQYAAADGRGGFLLHAGRPPRRVHLHRQRRQRRAASPGLRFQRRCHSGRGVVLGAARRNGDAGGKTDRDYCSASRCPSNTVGWQGWLTALRAAQSLAAMLALGSGPATRRNSTAPALPSRTAMTGRSPSNSAGCAVLRVVHSVRRPSIEALPPTSMPKSVLVATDSAAPGVPVARWPAATRDWLAVVT